jgi:hypothetical protein
MEEKAFADLVIQEIHTLGENVSELDRRLELKLDKVYERMDDNKKCNEVAHKDINDKLDVHKVVHAEHQLFHVECKDDCYAKAEAKNTQIDTKVSHGVFRWVVGGVTIAAVTALITIGGLSLAMQTKLERHIYFSEFVYHEVTGQKWSDSSRESLLKAKEGFREHMNGLYEEKTKNVEEEIEHVR